MKRVPHTQTEVLDWLKENHPELHMAAELDRAWIWLPVDLRGDENKPTRESIKGFGFIFSRRGGHLLPSGKLGMWGHSCDSPAPFIRKRKTSTTTETDTNEATEAEIAAFLA